MSTPLLIVSCVVMALVAVLAVRLAREASRRRSAPEWLMASFFAGGLLAYATAILRQVAPAPAADPGWLTQLGQIGFGVPAVTIALFTWVVFRRSESWARALAIGIAGVVACAVVFQALIVPLAGLPETWVEPGSTFFWSATACRAAAFVWACAEAILYWRMAVRRTALGMGDALVTNRFLLWGIWSGAAAALLCARVIATVVYDALTSPANVPAAMIVFHQVAGIACAGAVWLTFAPPGFYRRWILAGSARA